MKIAIASGKGGTGKTTLSTNLASYIAEQEPVLLCDLDVEEPNSGLFLHLELQQITEGRKNIPFWIEDKCTHCGICSKVCSFNALVSIVDQILVYPELCHSCHACTGLCPSSALVMEPRDIGLIKEYRQGAFTFMESRLNLGEEQAVPLIHQSLKLADSRHSSVPWVLYDAAPGTSCSVIEIMKEADKVILVTEPTPFGLNDLKLAVETAKLLKKDIYLVINRYEGPYPDLDEYIFREELTVIGRIPLMKEIAELYARGDLLYPTIAQVRSILDDIYTLLKETG